MKTRLVVLAVGAVALLAPGVAEAGCMATVGLSSLPKPGLAAGEPWIVTVRVLQHGRTPMVDTRPEVRIRKSQGRLIRFRAVPTRRIGSYRARVVFPAAGVYRLSVYDGFPAAACARVHTFRPVVIAAV